MRAGIKRLIVWLVLAAALVTTAAAERRLRQKVDPVYPDLARRINLSGSVRLAVTVTAEGNVRKVDVLGGNPVLAQAAVDAVRRWRYEPGPEETLTVTVEFKQ